MERSIDILYVPYALDIQTDIGFECTCDNGPYCSYIDDIQNMDRRGVELVFAAMIQLVLHG